ncbi:MAG: hypothetical protein WBL44_07850 [Nitrososphaeraceae archaeon]
MNKQLTVGVIVMIILGTFVVTTLLLVQSTYVTALVHTGDLTRSRSKAPIAMSGDNTYIAWWTNKTGNDEVMFRASTDGSAMFADKINLSNSIGAESQDVEIAAAGDNVVITWWERNQTAEEPVAKISTDNGATFGPLLKLATNGTISDGTISDGTISEGPS